MAKSLPAVSDSVKPIANAGSPTGFNPSPTVKSPNDYKTASRMSSLKSERISHKAPSKHIDYSQSSAPSIPRK